MRFFRLSFVVTLIALAAPTATRAEQARDWMAAAQPAGTYANLDVVFPGVQAQLEHRMSLYGQANELSFKVNALPTLLFYESQADVDLRILVLTLGASAGFRDVFHNIEFPHGTTSFGQAARRDIEFGGSFNNAVSGFGEGRATLSLPFNDHLVLVSVNALRVEGGRDRTFDWRLGIVRDAGALFRSDTVMLFKHRDFGAIGPQIQVLNYAMDGLRNTQVNYGFTFTTRLGLRKRNDLLFFSLLVGAGGTVNGQPTQDVYGAHLFKMPVTFQLAYRMVLAIASPAKAGDDSE